MSIEARRVRMRKARWDKTDICDHINRHFDVEGLCKGLPERVQKVIDKEGDRIIKCEGGVGWGSKL